MYLVSKFYFYLTFTNLARFSVPSTGRKILLKSTADPQRLSSRLSAWGFAVGPVMSQATWLDTFFKLHFFATKQAKMDFIFKLSFFLHSVCDQPEFQKKAKFFIIKQGKNRELKKKRKSIDDVIFPCCIQWILLLHSVHSRATFSVFNSETTYPSKTTA